MLSSQAVMRAQLRDAKAEGFVPRTGRVWHLAWASGTTPSTSIRAGALASGLRTNQLTQTYHILLAAGKSRVGWKTPISM